MLPLDCVFGFFTYVRVALSNLFIRLELFRNFMSVNATKIYSLVIRKRIVVIEFIYQKHDG